MVKSCCVSGCSNRADAAAIQNQISFFRFPVNKKKRHAWIRAIGRRDWAPNAHTYLCSAHFEEGWHSDEVTDVNYAPTIFKTACVVKQKALWKKAEKLMPLKTDALFRKARNSRQEQHMKFSLDSHSSYCTVQTESVDSPVKEEHDDEEGEEGLAKHEGENDSYLESDDQDDTDCQQDTEDASETDVAKSETPYTEIKEQMYQDKLAFLKKQLKQLEDGSLPEFLKRNKKIDQQYRERLKLMEVFKEYELDVLEREYKKEKKLAAKDFEEKKVDLKESLIADLEEKKRSIESERSQLELTGGHCHLLLSASLDAVESKPMSTRKLRRRPNDPVPIPEKRRKPSPTQINFFLDECEIMEDLRIINKVGGKPLSRKPIPTISPVDAISDVKIDDGRLYFDKRWFHRNQPVLVECKEASKFSGVITAIGTQEVWIRKSLDNSKIKIYLAQLQKGKFVLRRKQT